MEQDYFTHFGLKPGFFIDESALKKKYYAMSRNLHPDLAAVSGDEQSDILQLSSYHNKAYETLKSFEGRVEYILQINALIGGAEQPKMDQEFLFEMMELNEAAADLADTENVEKQKETAEALKQRKKALLDKVQPTMQEFDESQDTVLLKPILDYYLKFKYLKRLEETVLRQTPSL